MSTRGERLIRALEIRGIRKQYGLAVAIDVHESAITRWKNNQTISVDNLILLCRELDISSDWLLTGRGTIDQHKMDCQGTHHGLMASLGKLNERSLPPLQDFIDSLF